VADQVKALRGQGKRVFYDHSENLWGFPNQEDTFNACNTIVCCSTRLAEITKVRVHPSVQVTRVPDLVEGWDTLPRHVPAEKGRLSVVWCGMGGNSFMARELEPIINSLGMDLVIISEWGDADIKWEQNTYLHEMAKHDIAICPQRVDVQPAKSNVKVTTAMGLGLPVVCSPLPSYLEAVQNGINGYVAATPEGWKSALQALIPIENRKAISGKAIQTAKNYAPSEIANIWLRLLTSRNHNIAVINNSLTKKYSSYGDYWIEYFRCAGANVDVFPYEEVDQLPAGYDFYFFVEVRYDVNKISSKANPRVLYTMEPPNLNHLPQFDVIATGNSHIETQMFHRGFTRSLTLHQIDQPVTQWWNPQNGNDRLNRLLQFLESDWLGDRMEHNEKIHTQNIDAFYKLLPPEERWEGGTRDKAHISYVSKNIPSGSRILDIGSADGWLALYLAKEGHQVSALEFVERGMTWTKQHADRLGVEIDLREGFIEDVYDVFDDKRFEAILAFEILEHLDYRRLPWYLRQMEKLLTPKGKIYVSLPDQDLQVNPEHLWTPTEELIKKLFKSKNAEIEWVDIPLHEIPGDWFIQYQKNQVRTGL
jgi:2-polyprenyl-3-methyl-5-hydroxy-6-metoxy-1,4-benzoquinol methylase